MSIYEAIGIGWVIFSSALATVGVLYFAWSGAQFRLRLDKIVKVKELESDELERMVR